MTALKALLRNPSSSFRASLPSRSTQRLLFSYFPLKHCLALWHSPVCLSHSAVTYFVLFHLVLPGIEHFIQNVYAIFFLVVFLLSGAKRKEEGKFQLLSPRSLQMGPVGATCPYGLQLLFCLILTPSRWNQKWTTVASGLNSELFG